MLETRKRLRLLGLAWGLAVLAGPVRAQVPGVELQRAAGGENVFDGAVGHRSGGLEVIAEQKDVLIGKRRHPAYTMTPAGPVFDPTKPGTIERTYATRETLKIVDRKAFAVREGVKGGLIGGGVGILAGLLALALGSPWGLLTLPLVGIVVGAAVSVSQALTRPATFDRFTHKHKEISPE